MAASDKPGARDGGPLNGFLRRWRRNASRAGVLMTVLAGAVVAGLVLFLVACKSMR
jgi:hypothetical protein